MTGGVHFSNMTTVQHPDGTTSQQPTASAPAATASTLGNTPQPDLAAAAAAPPPSGPPPPPTTPAAATAPEPQPNRQGTSYASVGAVSAGEATPQMPAASSAPAMDHPRVVSHIAPPIGALAAAAAAAAMANQHFIILQGAPSPAPTQNVAYAGANTNQPFLWVNPPLVAPSVPAPQPGNTGSWCYPRRSPFWAGELASQTNPPPQFYMAEQGYVAQPAYVASRVATLQQVPQVQYYVNGSTVALLC
ncbi:hypothetical protein F4804DRAFT_331424 [Jackrogersella minutella]|nr:hypothetical protein F4804DRAFT_331424 [Jackrogersella minutella]